MRALVFLLALVVLPIANAGEVATAADQVHPLLIGTPVPDAALSDVDGKAVSLRAAIAGKPTLLVFYRGSWCPFCNLQLSNLRKIQQNLVDLGYQMIAISPDRPENLRKMLDKNSLTYTLLSDSNIEALKAFGIAFRVDAKTTGLYHGYGIDLDDASGTKNHALPVPSVFIVDDKGVVQFEYVNPDYKVRVPEDVLLAAAKAVIEQGKRGKTSGK